MFSACVIHKERKWNMEEFCTKIRLLTILETKTPKHRKQQYSKDESKAFCCQKSRGVKLINLWVIRPVKQSVWVIIPTMTFYFHKLSSDKICAQWTDGGLDKNQ